MAILAQADDLSLQNDPHIHFISTSTTSDDDTYDHVLLLLYIENITDNFENGKNQHWEAPSFAWDNVNDFINLKKIKKAQSRVINQHTTMDHKDTALVLD